jgi:hypothetical protein
VVLHIPLQRTVTLPRNVISTLTGTVEGTPTISPSEPTTMAVQLRDLSLSGINANRAGTRVLYDEAVGLKHGVASPHKIPRTRAEELVGAESRARERRGGRTARCQRQGSGGCSGP